MKDKKVEKKLLKARPKNRKERSKGELWKYYREIKMSNSEVKKREI